jgi:hypothetical protein
LARRDFLQIDLYVVRSHPVAYSNILRVLAFVAKCVAPEVVAEHGRAAWIAVCNVIAQGVVEHARITDNGIGLLLLDWRWRHGVNALHEEKIHARLLTWHTICLSTFHGGWIRAASAVNRHRLAA